MSNYKISKYSYDRVRELDVGIKPSKNKNKKIDVYKDGKFITSIGAKNYKDYPTYILEKGEDYPNERRKLYKIRHQKDRNIKGSRGWYSSKLLW